MSADKLDGINATRMELISLRTRKTLAQNGYNLLNKKLETLTNEMAMGPLKVKETSLSFALGIQLEAKSRSLMGVKVPIIASAEQETQQTYTFIDTSATIDDAIKKFQEALQLIIKLAEVQSTITRLATEIQSTKRRVNALKNIVIPRFDSTIRWIALTLGEQEREEFVRLKKVKARLEAKEENQD